MKDAICLTLFIAKVLCFVAFIIVLKPAAISVIQASVKPAHCEMKNSETRGCSSDSTAAADKP